MGRKAAAPQKYGSPLFAAAFVPAAAAAAEPALLFGGGGGAGSHGVRNRVLALRPLAGERADGGGAPLPVQPSAQADTGAEAPQALAVHPGGAVAVVACDGGLRALSVAQQEQGDVLLASRAEDDARLAGVAPPLGRLTAAAFAPDGAQLAVGGAAGDVRALSWPSLQEVPLAAGVAHGDTINALAYSEDGALLVSTGADGKCVVRAAAGGGQANDLGALLSGAAKGSLRGAAFASGRLFTGCNVKGEGHVVKWRLTSEGAAVEQRRRIFREPLTSLAAGDAEGGGALVAAGSSEGDVMLLTGGLATRSLYRAAHGIFVTAVAVAPGGLAAASVSADAGVRVLRAPRGSVGTLGSLLFLLALMIITIAAAVLVVQAHLLVAAPPCTIVDAGAEASIQ